MSLFDSIEMNHLTLKNRVVMPPMCMYMAGLDGKVTPFHHAHYFARSFGGVGLIIVEATGVEPRGRITNHDLGLWSDDHILGMKDLVDTIHSGGAKAAIQLGHAGRKSTTTLEPIVGPSAIAYSSTYQIPTALTIDEIQSIVQSFKSAARRAALAGFDLIEIHGAHGYLINQFISPLSNHRSDAYGGSLDNRIRFLLEIISAIREVWKGPLGLRISAEEYAIEGHHLEDTLRWLAKLPTTINLLNVSSGGVVSVSPKVYPGYQMPLSAAIRSKNWKTLGGGLITTVEQINHCLETGEADLVYIGRELLRNPYFMLHAAKESGRLDLIPSAYERGFK